VRKIAIARFDLKKGEQMAHACANACSIKGEVKKNISPSTGSGKRVARLPAPLCVMTDAWFWAAPDSLR
jgi:hypothetical protein